VKRIRHVLQRIGSYKLWLLHLEVFPKFGQAVLGRDTKPHTTYSKHGYAVKPNLVKDLEVKYPNQVYVTDVTYIWVGDCWYYLILITDKYSRKIVGWELSKDHSHHAVERAVNTVLVKNKQNKPIILHSDRGSEFCCHDLISFLQQKGFISSMTDEDHCAQNALAERMNGILKQEFIPQKGFIDFGIAKASISQSIKLYNMARPHGSLAMKTPDQVHSGDYDHKGKKLRNHGSTKSAGEVLLSLVDNNEFLMKIRKDALS